jgi:hypothetical protein
MTIKQQGGVFGRNPTFNDVDASSVTAANLTSETLDVDSSNPLVSITDRIAGTPYTSSLVQSGSHLYIDNKASGALRFRTGTSIERLNIAAGWTGSNYQGWVTTIESVDSGTQITVSTRAFSNLLVSDTARIHVGVIAQDVAAAFEAEGLNPENYGLFCHDIWWTDENGKVLHSNIDADGSEIQNLTKNDRFGIRYDELLAFVVASYIDQ